MTAGTARLIQEITSNKYRQSPAIHSSSQGEITLGNSLRKGLLNYFYLMKPGIHAVELTMDGMQENCEYRIITL